MIEWEGTEAEQQFERLKACRERRAQWGEGDCDKKGTCEECEQDMAEALETEDSRAARKAAAKRAALAPKAPPQMPPDAGSGSDGAGENCTCQRYPTHQANDCPTHGLEYPHDGTGDRA